MAPTAALEEWAKVPQAERKAAEEKMRGEWNAWTKEHGNVVAETVALGKTKTVNKDVVSDTKNGMMLYSIVVAESHEAASKLFAGHPHFGIPGATIEVMEVRPM